MPKRYKKDNNHDSLVAAMRAFTAVHDLSAAGDGIPDGCAWVKDGWHFFDIKNPETAYGKSGLNDLQKTWAEKDRRGGPVWIISSIDEAQDFALGAWNKLRCYPPRQTSDPEKISAVEYRGTIR